MHFFPQLTFTNRLWKPFPCQSYLLCKLSGISYYVYTVINLVKSIQLVSNFSLLHRHIQSCNKQPLRRSYNTQEKLLKVEFPGTLLSLYESHFHLFCYISMQVVCNNYSLQHMCMCAHGLKLLNTPQQCCEDFLCEPSYAIYDVFAKFTHFHLHA